MKKRILLIFNLFLLFATVFQLHAQKGSEIDQKKMAQLKAFLKDHEQGILTKNAFKFSTYYADDIRLMPAFNKTVKSKENADLYYQEFFKKFNIKNYKREMIETLDFGSQIVVLGIFAMKLALKSTKKEAELKGKYINIWRKEQDGLSLITDIWNYSHHTELTDYLRFENVPGVIMAMQPHLPYDTDLRYEIAALDQFLETVITEHDYTVWLGMYAKDGIFMYSYEPIYRGRKELDPFMEKHMKQLPIFEKLDVRNDQIDDFGNYVIEYASHIAN